MYSGNSLDLCKQMPPESLDLIVTSPPFGLVREKEYGNVPADEYVEWFMPFATEFYRLLKDTGSLVIDIGGAWNKGLPTRNLYQVELLLMLCKDFGFHLAQEFYWWNPAKLPTPAEWVTIRRIRVKDSINQVWWLSKTPWPKASNRRVLQPYSASMMNLLENGYKPGLRPSGHDISATFGNNNGAAIPPNLIAIANTESQSEYVEYCNAQGMKLHPARFPEDLPGFFIKMLTDEGDTVFDPFAGSCVTGAVSESMRRNWICSELRHDYLEGAIGRFPRVGKTQKAKKETKTKPYTISRPHLNRTTDNPGTLEKDGGRTRKLPSSTPTNPVDSFDSISKDEER